MRRRIGAAMAGAGMALLPLVVLAEGTPAQTSSRALGVPQEMKTILVVATVALAGVLVTAGIGFLYRLRRNLDWAFQRPDPPADGHH